MANRPSKIVIGIPNASYDGRYYGRYPLGDKPNTGAALAANSNSIATQVAQLQTAIRLGAPASVIASLAGGLNTAIKMGGSAIDVAAATAVMQTAIRLVGAANVAASSTAALTTGGADAYGITTYEMQSLVTGLTQGGAYFNDNTSGAATLTWTSDGTGNFARMVWPAGGGNAGPAFDIIDTTNPQIYVRWDYRRSVTDHSKRMKLFGRGYSANYSNFNVHLNYSGNALGIQYSDKTTGGDIDVGFFIGSYPTLTGGTAFSQSPHPVLQTQTATNEAADNTWHTHEFYGKHSSDGNHDGELAYWYDGTLIFWANSAYTCRTGGQGFVLNTLGDYIQSNASAVTEDFRKWSISHDRPVGRGI